jgi:uncharacterized protein
MPQFIIRVFPHSRKNIVEKTDDLLKVRVTAPAIDGKANKAALELLADHFQVNKSSIRIVRGEKSRNKLIEIIS